ncbi:MAG TPA: GntG family PLP-dependent aldolase [Myxococcales bacterium]|nr:GntG family PLP-dependent aldolase [Myxococcales bacterium]
MNLIDLRSDTVTRPTPGMRKAMAEAEVGDDVFGDDPTVRALEERVAELLGLPFGLFTASGSQANQLAVGAQCRPGDELLAEAGSHSLNFEGGAVSALWGVQPRALEGERGLLSPEQIGPAVRPLSEHYPRTRMLALENTHNRGGGTVWPIDRFRAVVAEARARGLLVHLDGARLFNAQARNGVRVSEYARLCDTAMVSFSKGLGAPVGSVLCGGADLIREARRLRKRLGGGMRQVGILAAAGLYALDHHVERLGEDHENARRLARGLAEIPGVTLDASAVETNLVFSDFPVPAADALARLKAQGVLATPEGSRPNSVRMVTHLDVKAGDIDEALGRIRKALER